MRGLHRNKRNFYYALYLKKSVVIDEYGNPTLESKIEYEDPIKMSAYVSASKGEADTELFGSALLYDKVIMTDDLNCPIDENTVLCIDKLPSYEYKEVTPEEGANPNENGWYELIKEIGVDEEGVYISREFDTGNYYVSEDLEGAYVSNIVSNKGRDYFRDEYVLTEDAEVIEGKTYYIQGPLLYDYIVKRVAKSFNSITYAISKVEKL